MAFNAFSRVVGSFFFKCFKCVFRRSSSIYKHVNSSYYEIVIPQLLEGLHFENGRMRFVRNRLFLVVRDYYLLVLFLSWVFDLFSSMQSLNVNVIGRFFLHVWMIFLLHYKLNNMFMK